MALNKKQKKKWITTLLVIVIIGVLGFTILARLFTRNPSGPTLALKTIISETGDIEKTVIGTGNLSADDSTNIDIPTNIKIEKVLVEPGDTVKQGDILATLDPSSLLNAVWDMEDTLWELDSNINKVKDDTESKYIKASVSGRIKKIFVEKGQSVEEAMLENNALLVLSIDGKMKVQFEPDTIDRLSIDQKVQVTLSNGDMEEGRISNISGPTCTLTLDDRYPELGETVTISLEDHKEIGKGVLEINQPIEITGTRGIVKSISHSVNTKIGKGDTLITLEESPPSREYETLYSQRIEKTQILHKLIDYSKTNTIIADFDGIIKDVSLIDNQVTGIGSNNPTESSGGDDEIKAFSIISKDLINLRVNIDELDILSISLGQQANISLDALPNKEFEGVITKIWDLGEVGQGVATYFVDLEPTIDPSMKIGMSASATIIVDTKEDIVKIPMDALQEVLGEEFVYVVTGEDENVLGEKRTVITGISDGEYVEIIEGLTAGEKINYIDTSGPDNPFGNMPFGNRFDGGPPMPSNEGDEGNTR